MADRGNAAVPPSKPLPRKPMPPALPPKPAFMQAPAKAPPPLPPKPQHVQSPEQGFLAIDGERTFLPGMCGIVYGYGVGGGADKKGGEEWHFEGMAQCGITKVRGFRLLAGCVSLLTSLILQVVAGDSHGAIIVVGKKQGLYTWSSSSADKQATPILETVHFSESG